MPGDASGPAFGFSDTWQLVVTTGTLPTFKKLPHRYGRGGR
jgi:hypothetical protein